MKYYNPIEDKKGYIHSIDMVYVEYFSYVNSSGVIEIVRNIHEKYPSLKYEEFLGKKPQHKYDYYLDTAVIGGVSIYAGKYNNYDKLTGTFDLLPMFKLRVNPNKYFNETWFQELLSELLKNASSGMLRKYDYAIDIPLEPRFVTVLNTRKEAGLYKGTRYYGQSGRHGYLKIYDKQKDMKREKVDIRPTTRVEHTIIGNQDPSLENVYVLDSEALKCDYSSLKDTDRAIVEMYLQLKALGYDYPLKLGRGKMEKLELYISGSYTLLEYGDALDRLIANIKQVFDVDNSPVNEISVDDGGFMVISEVQQAELDKLFGG